MDLELLANVPPEAREHLELFFRELEPHLHHLTGFSKVIKVSAPDTTFARMDQYLRALTAKIDALPPEEFQAFMTRLVAMMVRSLSHPAVREWILARQREMVEAEEEKARATRDGRLLLDLAAAVSAKIPHAAGMIILESLAGVRLGNAAPTDIAAFGQARTMRAVMRVSHALDVADGLRGEERCRALLAAAGGPMETLYTRYLRLLDGFLQVLHDRKPLPAKLSFGQLVREVHHGLPDGLGRLVDLDVTTRRNASCHENWRYLPGRSAVEFWDADKPHKIVSLETFERRTQRAFRTSMDGLCDISNVLLNGDLFLRSGMLQAQLSMLCVRADGEISANEEAMHEWVERGMGPYMRWRIRRDA